MATADRGRRGTQQQSALEQALTPGKPVIPYPPTLKEDLRGIWLATVNTKSADYWNESDIPLLEMYCRCVADIRRLSEEIDEEGEVIENIQGNAVINPKLTVRAFSENRLMSLCTKTRLQPQARSDTMDSPAKGKKQAGARKAAAVIDADPDDLLGGQTGGMH